MASFAAAVVFAWCYWKKKASTDTPTQYVPSVAVILCVRGIDPFLRETIIALAKQTYENFRILAIVDHRSDPAWEVLYSVQDELMISRSRIEIQELEDHDSRRGLKCSSLLQAIKTIQEDIVVTIDSDAVPKPNWLVSLVRPLEDHQVGATTGNQWFEPASLVLGTWVRSVWHAGAVVPTAVLGNAWAGAFAMRRQDLFESGLVNHWSRSIIDDGPVRQSLARLKKQLRFVPEAISINREECSLGFCFRYVARMLTWSRLFESTFWITLLHMAVFVGAHIASVSLLIYSCIAINEVDSIAWPAIGVALLFGLQFAGYFLIRATILSHQNVVAFEQKNINPSLMARMAMVGIAFPFTLAAYAFGAISAVFVREIYWRQIRYQVRSGTDVTMSDYHPFSNRLPDQQNSI